MLEFEHIVQINDPQDTRLKPMRREDLWLGLLLRARDPGRFNSGLTCRVAAETAMGFRRIIEAGGVTFEEQVSLTPGEAIHTRTTGAAPPIHAESITTIEEPAEGWLFVRFIYRRDLDEGPQQQMVAEHLKAAYQQLDIDAIALIRLLVNDAALDQPLN